MTVTKRYMLLVLGVVVLLFLSFRLSADTDMDGRSLDQIIAEIEKDQNVDTISGINPDRASEKVLEELGDAVMGVMLQDPQQHEWMDRMMGGEGSEQLASMHRYIGYRYLQNDGNLTAGLWGPGMSGYGMMGPGMSGYGMIGPGMRGYGQWDNGWYGQQWPAGMSGEMVPWIGILCLVLLIAVIVLCVALVKSRKTHSSPDSSGSSSEIIRSRYAAGKITREEYLQKMNDLKKPV